MERAKIKTSEFVVQSLSTLVICFLAVQTGFVYAWPSYNVANFKSNMTVLAEPMSSLEISLLGSLPNLGGLAASPFCGWAFNTYGRKYATMLFGLPYIFAWSMISQTSSVPLVLVAVAIAGIGVAGQNVSLIYISEIAHDSIRGGLTACSAATFFLGILISYVIGGNLPYMTVVYIHLTTSVIAILLLMLLPESPVFLVLVGREEDAAKSISFYRRVDVKSKEVEAELAKIRLMVGPNLEKMLEAAEADDENGTSEKLMETMEVGGVRQHESAWKFFWKSKSSQRALTTVLTLMAATIMMGCVVLQVYAEPLFAEAVPSMPSSQCAIFVALDFLIASSLCVFVVDKFGRKSILIGTSLGSGVFTAMLGSQLQFHWAPHWFTAALIYAYGFVYTVGCAVIPFVLTAEVFLPEVRSFCNSVSLAFVWIFNFITLVIFNPLVDAMGLGPVFYLFSVVCFAGAAYTQFYLPETKGLSADAIQVLFLKKWGFSKSK
ncbi:facilitated trehalose transporter Tret1-like [Anticarsia gemmatalis]|uniref:facilitated trehalose transporter Tret1-like n=1 Tax=Anticarsia gemmatalis TaxID=129554 RepID=UPI003F76109A